MQEGFDSCTMIDTKNDSVSIMSYDRRYYYYYYYYYSLKL